MTTETGYYFVGEHRFKSKISAIMHANQTKADVNWYFYNEVYDAQDWAREPTTSLLEFYKIRAQQIREEYDYVIVMYSGGADSSNVVHSFLENDIHIDEVIAGAPMSGLSNFKFDGTSVDPTNAISETKYAQLPGLEKIRNKNSRIKITIHDYFEDLLEIKDESWLYDNNLSQWCNPSVVRHRLEKFSHIKSLIDQGKKIGIVYGIDKPILVRSGTGNLYCTIPDGSVNFLGAHFSQSYDNVDTVLFYFTPRLPQMLVKQSHEAFRYLYKPENKAIRESYLWDRSKTYANSNIRASFYQRAIVPAIYPGIASDAKVTFQAHKPAIGFKGNGELDSWIFNLHKDQRFMQVWTSEFTHFINSIDKKYLNEFYGFKPIYLYWKVGHESEFDITPVQSEIITDTSSLF
jgi:hypothetical protein